MEGEELIPFEEVGQLDTTKRSVLIALEERKGIVTDACASVGLARSTFYHWMNTDAVFKAEVDSIQDVALDYVEGKLFERIDGVYMKGKGGDEDEPSVYTLPPDTTAIIFYLKTKGKKRGYVERTELTGKDGDALIPSHDLSKLSLDELKNLEALTRKLEGKSGDL